METVRLQQTVPSELKPHRMTISSPFPYKQSPYSGWFLPPTQLLLETRTVTFCAFSSNYVKHPECITCVTGCWFPGSVQKILPLGGYGSLVSGLIHSVDLEKLQLLGWSQKFISGIEVCKYVRTGVNFPQF